MSKSIFKIAILRPQNQYRNQYLNQLYIFQSLQKTYQSMKITYTSINPRPFKSFFSLRLLEAVHGVAAAFPKLPEAVLSEAFALLIQVELCFPKLLHALQWIFP